MIQLNESSGLMLRHDTTENSGFVNLIERKSFHQVQILITEEYF